MTFVKANDKNYFINPPGIDKVIFILLLILIIYPLFLQTNEHIQLFIAVVSSQSQLLKWEHFV